METTIKRNSDWYRTTQAYDSSFNSATYSFGYPTEMQASSNVNTAPRITTKSYQHKPSIWVLGLEDTVTINGRLTNEHDYDNFGRRIWTDEYGVRVATYTYHTNAAFAGAMHSFSDGIGRTSYALDWKRGGPQQVIRADGSNIYQSIDDKRMANKLNGWQRFYY